MGGKIVRIVVWGAVLIAVAVVGYIRFSRGRVNQAIDDANASIDAGDAELAKIKPSDLELADANIPSEFKVKRPAAPAGSEQEFAGGAASDELVLDRDKIGKRAAPLAEAIASVTGRYRDAAAKFEEAKKSARDEVVVNYFELMARAYDKRAESQESLRKSVLLLTDKSVPSLAELTRQQQALVKASKKAETEFESLQEQAKKLHDENKNKFN
jgi:hypothetical protein